MNKYTAYRLRCSSAMNSVCRRCEDWIDGSLSYTVLSQDRGGINMTVCDRCAMVARRLGLAVVKMAAPVECED